MVKTNDIDALLKESLSQEFSLSSELDTATWQKMKAVPQKKRTFFLTLMSVAGFALLAMETMIILLYVPHTVLKITFLYLCLSTICIMVLYLIISININLKRIL